MNTEDDATPDILRDLYANLGIEPGWVLGEPDHAKGIPVVTVAWPRVNGILDHHGADAVPVLTLSRGRLDVEITVYAWRRWERGMSWPWDSVPRYRDVPGIGTIQELRYHIATITSSSPPGWDGRITFDGGMQIGGGL